MSGKEYLRSGGRAKMHIRRKMIYKLDLPPAMLRASLLASASALLILQTVCLSLVQVKQTDLDKMCCSKQDVIDPLSSPSPHNEKPTDYNLLVGAAANPSLSLRVS